MSKIANLGVTAWGICDSEQTLMSLFTEKFEALEALPDSPQKRRLIKVEVALLKCLTFSSPKLQAQRDVFLLYFEVNNA